MPDIADVFEFPEGLPNLAQRVVDGLESGGEPGIGKEVEVGSGSGGSELVPAIAVAMIERAVGAAVETEKEPFGEKRGGHGEVATGEAFGQGDEIRSNVFGVVGEAGTGAIEAGQDFVKDEESAVGADDVGGAMEETGGVHEEAGGTLNEGLGDESGELRSKVVGGLFNWVKAFPLTTAHLA